MAGANNKALKKAGMTPREVETFRATGGKSLRATVTATKHSPTVQGANADFRAKAAAGLKSMAERKAALQAARQQRVGKSLGAAMQVARGMRQKQAADAPQKAAAVAAPTAKANPRTVRALDSVARAAMEKRATGILPTTRRDAERAAKERANQLADAALADLAQGKKTFIKGKQVFVPYSDDARRQRKLLQESAFDDGDIKADRAIAAIVAKRSRAEGIRSAAAEERARRAAADAYRKAGLAEINRRFG